MSSQRQAGLNLLSAIVIPQGSKISLSNMRILNETEKYLLKKYVSPARLIESCCFTYSVEITYGINSVISKLMTFVENTETGQFFFS
jgi:hypothetical protein